MAKEKKSKSSSLRAAAADAVGPVAKNFGKEIAPVGTEAGRLVRSAAHTLMRPAFSVVWGADKIFDWIEQRVAERVDKIPESERKEADIRIAGPALEAVRYLENEEEIRDLFASLIAKSMDKREKTNIHSSYIEIAKQLDALDAKIFKLIGAHYSFPIARWAWKDGIEKIIDRNIFIVDFMSNSENVSLITRGLQNLDRLKLIEIDFMSSLAKKERYSSLGENPPEFINRPNLPDNFKHTRMDGILTVTEFGRAFFSIIS